MNTPNAKNKDSHKTPGGISKSLLTPCRRIGLSKKWKKTGVSPFISPLATDCSNSNVKLEDLTPKKSRTSKLRNKEVSKNNVNENDETDQLTALSKEETESNLTKTIEANNNTKSATDEIPSETFQDKDTSEKESPSLSKLIKARSLKKSQKVLPKVNKQNPEALPQPEKAKSPNSLTKECIVVIQKKINKISTDSKINTENKTDFNPVSQALFDSDTDDTPLSKVNKNNNKTELKRKLSADDDDDFCHTTTTTKVKKLENKKTSTGDLRKTQKKNIKHPKQNQKAKLSQSSNSFDEDDEDFDTKKTILIKKTYDKTTKPLKAKSTGSITKKDIEELKARIEHKKNVILARAMTQDTEELRNLIKKWKKGCQDALIELMDLMKSKFPDKQHMEYSEILQMLKIPSKLVGYDSEDDCFLSPNDKNIILSTLEM